MYKLLFTLQISLFTLLFLSSCSENDYSSFCPTWLGFTYKTGSYPNYVQGKSGGIASVNAGDSLHITACQKERGRLINGTDYSWTVCYDTLDTKMNDDQATMRLSMCRCRNTSIPTTTAMQTVQTTQWAIYSYRPMP